MTAEMQGFGQEKGSDESFGVRGRCLQVVHRVPSSLLGPVVPSVRALSGRFKATAPEVISSTKFSLFASSSSSLSSLGLSDTKFYEPEIRARFGTASHFCKVVVVRR